MMAKMMYNTAEDIVGKTDGISNLNISISFEPASLPELTITRSHLPRNEYITPDNHLKKEKNNAEN